MNRRCSWAISWPRATGRPDISEISKGDTVLIIGAGPTGICTLQCVLLKEPGRVIVCDIDRSAWPWCAGTGPRC